MNARIVAVWAYVVTETNGDEGVPAIHTPDGWIMPLMGGDLDRMRSLRPVAQNMANALNKPLELCVFREREFIELVTPVVTSPLKES